MAVKGFSNSGLVVFTIGHSIHSIAEFINLLRSNSIDVIADIRSIPYSGRAPHFGKDSLEKVLRENGIRYIFLGKELGGRPEKPEYYDAQGYVLYSRIAESASFHEGFERVLKGIKEYRVALMCSEENPENCHRQLLVGRVLLDRGIKVIHIRGDGTLEEQTDSCVNQHLKGILPGQQGLFVNEEAPEWKSTQSVLRKKAQKSSSAN
jgi:uncharacterized protein (DUF488 family)